MKTRWASAVLGLLLALPAVGSTQDIPPERQQVESQLTALQADIENLLTQLSARRQAHQTIQEELRSAALEIQTASEALRALEAEEAALNRNINTLESESTRLGLQIDDQRQQLARQLVSAYRLGRRSRLKLLLNQEDPDQVSRLLAYHDYLNRARVQRIDEFSQAVAAAERTRATLAEQRDRLADTREQQQQTLEVLEAGRARRATAAGDLAAAIDSDEARLQELQRNRADLEALLERLSQALADIPEQLDRERRLPDQRGSLPWPVAGRLSHGFGQLRDGARTRGWLIAAEAGTAVRSVGYGRVAFADWLRGFGLLLIVDHGDGLMSLYGHNDSLLRDVGDWVETGDEIATVGDSGGAGQTALYFEMRQAGAAVDPRGWLQRQP